jgi:ADP-ribose pyrophosphatase YjhB (NUDIX family)
MKLQVGVKALIQNSSGKYLLLRRAKTMVNETETHWDIPGGRIEPEEGLQNALRREIAEETGLRPRTLNRSGHICPCRRPTCRQANIPATRRR